MDRMDRKKIIEAFCEYKAFNNRLKAFIIVKLCWPERPDCLSTSVAIPCSAWAVTLFSKGISYAGFPQVHRNPRPWNMGSACCMDTAEFTDSQPNRRLHKES